MTVDICTPEELAQFAEISAWCFKHRKRVHSRERHGEVQVAIADKPRKKPASSQELQARRAAINRAVWGHA